MKVKSLIPSERLFFKALSDTLGTNMINSMDTKAVKIPIDTNGSGNPPN